MLSERTIAGFRIGASGEKTWLLSILVSSGERKWRTEVAFVEGSLSLGAKRVEAFDPRIGLGFGSLIVRVNHYLPRPIAKNVWQRKATL